MSNSYHHFKTENGLYLGHLLDFKNSFFWPNSQDSALLSFSCIVIFSLFFGREIHENYNIMKISSYTILNFAKCTNRLDVVIVLNLEFVICKSASNLDLVKLSIHVPDTKRVYL